MIKPILAGKAPTFDRVQYPVLATPKLDGIRCLVVDGKAVSRSLKPIPNYYTRHMIETLVSSLDHPNLDGELILHGRAFNEISSAIMRRDGAPPFVYKVFDVREGGPYNYRVLDTLYNLFLPLWCEKVIPEAIFNEEQLREYEEKQLRLGYEGVIIRTPSSPYKHGRSTTREGYMLKIKRFTDSEAIVIGYTQLRRNMNPAFIGELGQTKRSSHRENKVPVEMLGTLLVRDIKTGMECELGTGYTEEERVHLWNIRESLVQTGAITKYKWQEHGTVERQRSGVYLGLRHPSDMS